MKQAAELGFLRALRTFKKNSGAALGTWIFIKVRKECQNQKQLEYITTSCSETRRHLPAEERLRVFENVEPAKPDANNFTLINEFFQAHKHLIKWQPVFVDRFVYERTKEFIENKFKIKRKELNEILKALTTEFRGWYR